MIAANPSAARRTPTTSWARDGRSSAWRSRCRPTSSADPWGCSGMEDVPPDLGDVGEDPDPQHHDHAGRQLAADAQLVAQVDDGSGDHDVGEEGHDEHLVVEDPFEVGAERAEDGV